MIIKNVYNFFVIESNFMKLTILKFVPCDVSKEHELLLTKFV
jgi:hypothetical protein